MHYWPFSSTPFGEENLDWLMAQPNAEKRARGRWQPFLRLGSSCSGMRTRLFRTATIWSLAQCSPLSFSHR